MRTEQHPHQHVARQHLDRRDVGASRTSLRRAGMAGLAATAALGATVAVPSPAAASGAGDSFAGPNFLAGVHGGVSFDNDLATAEPGEPSHANAPSGAPDLPDHSVWFRWQSPINGRVVFRTRGSTFDTVMAAYTGPGLGSLTKIASNDDTTFAKPGGGTEAVQSQIGFKAAKGQSYHIAVDSFTGSLAPDDVATGTIHLSWDANDNFANARPLATSKTQTLLAVGDNTGATRQKGESTQIVSRAPARASIWFSYTAPKTGTVSFSTAGSEINALLGAYRGTKVDQLAELAFSESRFGSPASFTLPVTAGQVVKIAIDGANDVEDEGPVVLQYGYAGLIP